MIFKFHTLLYLPPLFTLLKFWYINNMQTARIGNTSSMEKNRRVNVSAGCYLLRKLNNDKFELLILYKKWPNGEEHFVLPKGHREKDENLEETATRETIEESGYVDFKLLKYLGSYTYELDWDEIQMKTDHYFLALLNTEENTEQKPEEYEE